MYGKRQTSKQVPEDTLSLPDLSKSEYNDVIFVKLDGDSECKNARRDHDECKNCVRDDRDARVDSPHDSWSNDTRSPHRHQHEDNWHDAGEGTDSDFSKQSDSRFSTTVVLRRDQNDVNQVRLDRATDSDSSRDDHYEDVSASTFVHGDFNIYTTAFASFSRSRKGDGSYSPREDASVSLNSTRCTVGTPTTVIRTYMKPNQHGISSTNDDNQFASFSRSNNSSGGYSPREGASVNLNSVRSTSTAVIRTYINPNEHGVPSVNAKNGTYLLRENDDCSPQLDDDLDDDSYSTHDEESDVLSDLTACEHLTNYDSS